MQTQRHEGGRCSPLAFLPQPLPSSQIAKLSQIKIVNYCSMNIIVVCEYSDIVSSSFRSKGHEVTSVDLVPGLNPDYHIIGNALDHLSRTYDMLIGFPPCKYLTSAQAGLTRLSPDRYLETLKAIEFFRKLFECEIEKIALENPPGIIPRLYKNYDQCVNASDFGDVHNKRICLWLKNLPPLISTCYNPVKKSMSNHVNSRMSQAEKSHIKSKFFPLVAAAMANQWG